MLEYHFKSNIVVLQRYTGLHFIFWRLKKPYFWYRSYICKNDHSALPYLPIGQYVYMLILGLQLMIIVVINLPFVVTVCQLFI